MNHIINFIQQNLRFSNLPSIAVTDVLEIVILSWLFYRILVWIRDTKAWIPVRGVLLLAILVGVAGILKMNTITWLVGQLAQVGLIGVVVIFQPELRRSLEEVGRKGLIPLFNTDSNKSMDERFTENTVNELVDACFAMGKVRTGALIVIEQQTPLGDYERTGIRIDGRISSQLILNIFEKNTPLHDGAVVVKGNRITAATCYLPLSGDLEISKELGTRHRAALGISEATDSVTIIVSEETGSVSVAELGILQRGLTREQLRAELSKHIEALPESKSVMFAMKHKKGQAKNEENPVGK